MFSSTPKPSTLNLVTSTTSIDLIGQVLRLYCCVLCYYVSSFAKDPAENKSVSVPAFFYCFRFFPHPIYYLRPSTPAPSPFPSRTSDPGSLSRLFFPPPHYGTCLRFLSRRGLISHSHCLVDFHRIFPRYQNYLIGQENY